MTAAASPAAILLVDDGELDEIAGLLEARGLAYVRLRGHPMPDEIPPPRDLLIATPRRADRVRRGSPPDAAPGSPLRVVVSQEDSPSLRRRMRRSGLDLLVQLPANEEIWRLLVDRALYHGRDRREDPRVAVGSSVSVGSIGDAHAIPNAVPASAILVDLSNRGCRLRTSADLSIDDPIAFTLPVYDDDAAGDGEALRLTGRVRRLRVEGGNSETGESPIRTLAVTFDEGLPESSRTRLTAVINRWASGPRSLASENRLEAPSIPPCQLSSLPDLTLDDETDPPVQSRSEVRVQLLSAPPTLDDRVSERRRRDRGRFASTISARTPTGPIVLIGRDVSAAGMRVEPTPQLAISDRFRIALHGPGPSEPFVVEAEVVREDPDGGLALAFRNLAPDIERSIEKLVACLPDVGSLEDDEIAGIGGLILSEIVVD
jgi:hypothetical protein